MLLAVGSGDGVVVLGPEESLEVGDEALGQGNMHNIRC
jgi:hypothetical protein